MRTSPLWRSALAAVAAFFLLLGAAHGDSVGTIVQSIGDARLGGTPAKAGDTVEAASSVSTGSNSYLYIKTVDSGFLILRPSSEARVVAYHVDAAQPANSRFKIELTHGVARSISGAALKNSRENFRFNTPVAAIGVRGTDFTVFTDQQTTRVTVISGGVVASGFGVGCGPEGSGPCEGVAKLELYASQAEQVLQVNRGQAMPQILRGTTFSPDVVAPPRADEPAKTIAGANGTTVAAPTTAVAAAAVAPTVLAPTTVVA